MSATAAGAVFPKAAFTVLIPARLASSRLPNKPLADIAGVPMVVRVAQRVLSHTFPASQPQVVVAGDSPEIIRACQAHGVQAVLTRTDHASGSDRLAEACAILGLPDHAVVINVQGDEPLIDPDLVWAVAALLQQKEQASMSTAAHRIDNLAEFENPNVVKVVLDGQSFAQYFSRASIPHSRDFAGDPALKHQVLSHLERHHAAPLRHIGIYGYRVGFLKRFPTLPQAPLEVVEALEQLRALWHGHRIAVHVSDQAPGPGVDTPEDLARVREVFMRGVAAKNQSVA